MRELRQELKTVCKTNSELYKKEEAEIDEIIVDKELKQKLLEGVKIETSKVREKQERHESY